MLFSRYKADFLRFFPENPANYVRFWCMNLKEKLPQNAGNRISEVLDFKISRGRIPPDPPTSTRFSASVNKTTGSAPAWRRVRPPRRDLFGLHYSQIKQDLA
jgi:hypothetical protein